MIYLLTWLYHEQGIASVALVVLVAMVVLPWKFSRAIAHYLRPYIIASARNHPRAPEMLGEVALKGWMPVTRATLQAEAEYNHSPAYDPELADKIAAAVTTALREHERQREMRETSQ